MTANSAALIRQTPLSSCLVAASQFPALDFFVTVEAMLDNQLLNLLRMNRSNQIVADCLELIPREEFRYQGDALAPLNEIIDIYSVRARINEKRGGKVEGYSHLLSALEAASVPSVRVHSLEFLTRWFIAFTDDSRSLLFGVLKSPKKSAAWYDPAKGYEE